jgi:hypothetical protein
VACVSSDRGLAFRDVSEFCGAEGSRLDSGRRHNSPDPSSRMHPQRETETPNLQRDGARVWDQRVRSVELRALGLHAVRTARTARIARIARIPRRRAPGGIAGGRRPHAPPPLGIARVAYTLYLARIVRHVLHVLHGMACTYCTACIACCTYCTHLWPRGPRGTADVRRPIPRIPLGLRLVSPFQRMGKRRLRMSAEQSREARLHLHACEQSRAGANLFLPGEERDLGLFQFRG